MRTTGDKPQCWWGDLCVSTCGQGVAVEESDQVGCGDWHFYGDDKYNFYQHHDDDRGRKVSATNCDDVGCHHVQID